MAVGFTHRLYAYAHVFFPGALCIGVIVLRLADPLPGGSGFAGKSLREMTLGNGYLGSRYDEERSEMRYLV
jgi:hypothetical protein